MLNNFNNIYGFNLLWLVSDCPVAQEGENDSGTTGKKKKKKKKKPAGAKIEEGQGKPVSG